MKNPFIRYLYGNAADSKHSASAAPDDREQDNTARVIDSAKAMSILGTVISIAGFLLLLLFVAWLKN